MSWFDTTGLASLAKNALKEAQKHIDKALDIQEDEIMALKSENRSKTEPTTPIQPLWPSTNPALWGSFTGSFFESPKTNEMITTPPKSGNASNETYLKRQSLNSNSDSVEILSSVPTTPGSELSATVFNSESVEVITTPNTSDLISPISARSPESVEIISTDEEGEEDDDSMSFSTVMDDTMKPIAGIKDEQIHKVTNNPKIDVKNNITMDINNQNELCNTLFDSKNSDSISKEAISEAIAILSDSSQSFENIQIPESVTPDEILTKIESNPNSGHTSADEVETTTSSDIEIISNPNGDSSSTYSACRASPRRESITSSKNVTGFESKNSFKGHSRIPSEVSTNSEDSRRSSNSEMDKLLHRINELLEILEHRDRRVLELSKQNAELSEKNVEIQTMLETKQKINEHIETEEYTQRLSALEKKFQMSIRERDALREQLRNARDELSVRISKEEHDKLIGEKEFMVQELQTEGEKLSKQILQHTNIIKKLRAKDKETDGILKKNREEINELSEEVERLKKSLAAKDEVERSQIEAVHNLTSENSKLLKENHSLKAQIEDKDHQIQSLRTSLDSAKKELQNRQSNHADLTKKAEAFVSLQSKNEFLENQNSEITLQLQDLREKLKSAEHCNAMREQKLRQENIDLMRRLEESEIRAEELTHEITLATIPLVKQLEALQETLQTRSKNWEKQEEDMLSQLETAQNKLKTLECTEQSSIEKENILNSKIKDLEENLAEKFLRLEQVNSLLQQTQLNSNLKEADYTREIASLKEELEKTKNIIDEYKEKCQSLEKNAEIEREKFYNSFVENPVKNLYDEEKKDRVPEINPIERTSPVSLDDSFGSSAWQMDDIECASNSGRNVGGGLGAMYSLNGSFTQINHSATMLENLQSSLKQKDGEISQLQWELSRLQAERNVLHEEISSITLELETLKDREIHFESQEKEFSELQQRYDALLQMYGEKVEETQELQLDLEDVKKMYKDQIDELLRQQSIS